MTQDHIRREIKNKSKYYPEIVEYVEGEGMESFKFKSEEDE